MNAKQMQQLEDQVLVRLVDLMQARSDAVDSRGGTVSKSGDLERGSESKRTGGVLENRVAMLIGMQDAAQVEPRPEFRLAVSRLISKQLVVRRRIANVEHSFFCLYPTGAGISRAQYAQASLLGKVLLRLGTR